MITPSLRKNAMYQTPIPITKDRFQNGLPWPDYVAQMKVNRERITELFEEIRLAPDDRQVFAQAVADYGGQLNIAAMGEDWCGDAVVLLPLVAHLAAEVPGAHLRIFVRSANPELEDAYAEDGITSIPVLSFFDADWGEVGRWVERSAAAQRRVDAWMAVHPGAEALRHSSDPQDRRAYRTLMKERLFDMIDWYRGGLWGATLEEWKSLLLIT
jgi:thiol-disulfide isomerase/thioredoxin